MRKKAVCVGDTPALGHGAPIVCVLPDSASVGRPGSAEQNERTDLAVASITQKMILNAGCSMNVEAEVDSAVVLMLRPQTGLVQEVRTSHLSIEPDLQVREVKDAFGNIMQRAGVCRDFSHLGIALCRAH
jgi:Bacterial transglutaminase-like N-terminal region